MAPTSPSPTTRERILAYLQDHHIASVDVLSHAWGLTRADIRYHLNQLIKQGEIERIPRPAGQALTRGRPAQRYRLAAAFTQDNYPALCSALLVLLTAHLPSAEIHSRLKELAEILARQYQPPDSPIQRYNLLVVFLNQQGYHARWEASPSGPRILLHNCPYAAILEDHPELCTFDLALLEHLAQAPFHQTARIDPLTGKPPTCIFKTVY